ncbi:MAG: flagellar filament protein FlaA [Treponema sp.]|nr:flagellar filament protein FlaA [Treponema sp.]
MKKGVKVFIRFALLSAICLPAVAQPSSRAIETFIVDTFDNKGDTEWAWNVQASAFVDSDSGYPKLDFFDGQPNSLRILNDDPNSQPKVLGLEIAYKRKGENWFEVYPEKDGKAFEIPFKGTVTQIDFWVWGANYLYYIDLLVRDADGRVYTLPAGNLAFNGWRNLIVTVPSYLRQRSRLRTGPRTMTFVGFRVRTDPDEYVDKFDIFFDQLKYTTNTLSNVFDGYELQNVDFGGSGSSGSSSNVTQDGK